MWFEHHRHPPPGFDQHSKEASLSKHWQSLDLVFSYSQLGISVFQCGGGERQLYKTLAMWSLDRVPWAAKCLAVQGARMPTVPTSLLHQVLWLPW